MTYLWQEERGKNFYRVQTDEKSIADKLKRRNSFHLSAVGLKVNHNTTQVRLWIFGCEFARKDIAKSTLKSLTDKKVKIDSEGVFSYG